MTCHIDLDEYLWLAVAAGSAGEAWLANWLGPTVAEVARPLTELPDDANEALLANMP